MKRPTNLLLIFVTFMILMGCSKDYRTYKKILGNYTLTAYTINGLDSLSSYKDSLGTSFNFFSKDQQNVWEISGKRNDGKEEYLEWYWEISNGNQLLINGSSGNGMIGTGPLGNYSPLEWDILNLTKKELDMKITWNGKDYSIELLKN